MICIRRLLKIVHELHSAVIPVLIFVIVIIEAGRLILFVWNH